MNRISVRQALARCYLTADARSLGLLRVALGAVLLLDLARRSPLLRDFYSNAGVLPNHTVLWRPPLPRLFSLFFPVSLGHEAALVFLLCAFCFSCLLIGWRTRFFHLASLLLAVSLHSRVMFVENGGAAVLDALVLWTAFLPLGRRFSVDAVLASLRARPDETPAELAPERLPPPDDRPVVSLAVLAVLLQLAAITGLTFANQSGEAWKDGSAFHYLLWQERAVTHLGWWARAHLPFAALRAATRALQGVEAAVPVLVLTPVLWRWTRPLAIAALGALAAGLALFVNLGVMAAALLAYAPLLLADGPWRWLRRVAPARGRARTVYYDAGCGVCFQVVRVLARMDGLRRLSWISNQERAALPADVTDALLERTILVVDPARPGRRWTRSAAFAQIFFALPLGRLWAWPLVVPGLRTLAGWAYDAFARNRTTVSSWLGLAACGLPGAPRPVRAAAAVPTPLAAWLRARLPGLRELTVAAALVLAGAELSASNAAVPPAFRWLSRPAWMMSAVSYAHVFQSWSLFAPEPSRQDSMVVVDAVTRDGRHVDPLNQVASRVAALPVDDLPQRLGQASLWSAYQLRIATAVSYHQALLEWLQRHPERTGRPQDALVSIDAWVVEHESPAPGQPLPQGVRRRLFLHWAQPGTP